MITLLKYAAIYGFAAGARRAPGRRKSLILRCALIALFAFTCRLPTTQAQVSASIRGVVMDAMSAPVAQVTVTVKNLETDVVRTVTTDEAGRYLVLALPVGRYEVRISKSGFQDNRAERDFPSSGRRSER